MKLLLIVAAALCCCACSPQPTGPTTINVYNHQSQGSDNGPSTQPTPSLGCAPVASVGASARDSSGVVVGSGNTPGVLIVGQVYALDASPKDSNGALLPSNCHAPVGQWTASPAGRVELLGNTSGFNPQLFARASGDVVVTFVLGVGPGSGMSVDLRLRVQ